MIFFFHNQNVLRQTLTEKVVTRVTSERDGSARECGKRLEAAELGNYVWWGNQVVLSHEKARVPLALSVWLFCQHPGNQRPLYQTNLSAPHWGTLYWAVLLVSEGGLIDLCRVTHQQRHLLLCLHTFLWVCYQLPTAWTLERIRLTVYRITFFIKSWQGNIQGLPVLVSDWKSIFKAIIPSYPEAIIQHMQSTVLIQGIPTGEKTCSDCWVIPEITMESSLTSPHSSLTFILFLCI